ncbi:MAG: hypothetical protein KGL39_52320 [Patescibacteria group bacterium]|nr:hypothetical protein [Patescibacteria group bacterium]
MQRYINSVADLSGHPVSGASVQVNTYPGGTAATIYSDNGITPQTNPITTPSDGGFSFYAENGLYELVISGNNIATQTITGINLFDQTETSAGNSVGFTTSGTTSGSVARALVDRGICVTDAPFNADPTGTNDSTASLNDAVAALGSQGGTVVLPPGDFLMDGIVISSSNVHIRGAGRGATKILKKNATGDLFQFGAVQQCSVKHLSIQPASGVTMAGGACFNFNTTGAIWNEIEDIYTQSMFDFLLTTTSGSSQQIHNLAVKQIRNDALLRYGAWLQGAIDPTFEDFQSFGSNYASGAAILYDSYCDGLILRGAIGGGSAFGLHAQNSQSAQAPRGLEAVACVFDEAGTASWQFDSLHYGKLVLPYAATQQTGANGMVIGADVYDLDIVNPRITYCNVNGVKLSGGTGISITGGSIIASNQAAGSNNAVEVGGAVSRLLINGTRIGPDPSGGLNGTPVYGVEVNTGATNIRVENCDFTGCASGAINDGSGGHLIALNNIGWVDKNAGVALITSGSTSVTFNHGCSATPTRVSVTQAGALSSGTQVVVTSLTATQMTITLTASQTSDQDFYWSAAVYAQG